MAFTEGVMLGGCIYLAARGYQGVRHMRSRRNQRLMAAKSSSEDLASTKLTIADAWDYVQQDIPNLCGQRWLTVDDTDDTDADFHAKTITDILSSAGIPVDSPVPTTKLSLFLSIARISTQSAEYDRHLAKVLGALLMHGAVMQQRLNGSQNTALHELAANAERSMTSHRMAVLFQHSAVHSMADTPLVMRNRAGKLPEDMCDGELQASLRVARRLICLKRAEAQEQKA